MPINLPLNIRTITLSGGPKKTVSYPQVSGMPNHNLEHLINRTIVQQTQELITQQTGMMPTTVEEMLGTFEIKNNQRQVLSLSLSNYTYHSHAAHGVTYMKPLTFDLQKGKLCQLKDLFKRDSQYVQTLSAIIKEQIKHRNIFLLQDFTSIKPNQDFYIADKALVVFFQLYEITPYAFGFPMFPISVYDLQEILDESGPLGRMAVNN
ncbi:DUF3298 and DUF4163 domain-containing protein [Neobacillus dielmonensis]|uniref:DUF3298 and DUF4163 domain-containing protein n=1 Tax=Neobacillus dielmonensis TaxID=1347369 RepID=UPI0009428772|nr:DUF3298 and DUF4163 domain-containing protein [Neobacillus dielmonensis]